MRIKVAMLTTDGREMLRAYGSREPIFGTAPEALIEGMASLPKVEVHVVSCFQQTVISPQKLGDRVFFHAIHVPKLGWMRSLYLGCIRAVRRKLHEIGPDIVHGQGTERDCAMCAVFSGRPNLITIHGNMRRIAAMSRARPLSFHWLAARLEGLAIRRAGGVVCLSTHTQTLVGKSARRQWLLPNAVHSSFFGLEPACASPPLLGCIANIYPLKNQTGLIRALDSLAATHPFQLAFVGSLTGTQAHQAEYRDLLAKRPWCRHVGFLERDALKSFLTRCTALVHPSLEDNCPMAIMEAMAAGLPVVASRIGGIPDLVQDGVTGWLCDPNEPASFSLAVANVLDQPERSREMGRRAKARALQRHHPVQVARRHVEIYEELLSSRP